MLRYNIESKGHYIDLRAVRGLVCLDQNSQNAAHIHDGSADNLLPAYGTSNRTPSRITVRMRNNQPSVRKRCEILCWNTVAKMICMVKHYSLAKFVLQSYLTACHIAS